MSIALPRIILLPLLALFGALVPLLAVEPGCDEPVTVYGPITVVRGTGAPQTEHFSFPAPMLDPGVAFRLVLINGDDAAGKPRATSAVVALNGCTIWSHADFKRPVAGLERDVGLQVWNSLAVTVWGKPTSLVTIRIEAYDPRPLTAAFVEAASASPEAVAQPPIAVRLSRPPLRPVTMGVALQAGSTASTGSDLQLAPTITFVAGQMQAAVPLTVLDDALPEAAETAILDLVATPCVGLGSLTRHTLTITDDDSGGTVPSLAFQVDRSRVDEFTATAVVVLQLSAPAASPVTVPVTVAGTATAGLDHTLTAGTVTVPAGATTAAIAVGILADALHEGDETVVITLGQPVGATLGAIATHTLTIADDDAPPSVAFTAATAVADESAGTAVATVRLSAASGFPVTVGYTVGGTAGSGDVSITPGTVQIPAGATEAALPITLLDDQLPDGDRTVILTLVDPVQATLGVPTVFTLTIRDDDVLPIVSCAAAASQAAESAGAVAISVQLDRAVAWPVVVQVAVAGDAVAGRDYLPVATSLTIPAGVRGVTLPVTLLDNAVDEPDRSLVLTLHDPTDAVLGAVAAHTLTILDDDAAPTVAFALAALTVDEGAGAVTLTVALSAASARTVVVPLVVTGTAGPQDAVVGAASLTFAPGATAATVPVTITDDVLHEPAETVIVSLGAPTAAVLGDPAIGTVTITDNDPLPVVAFAVATSAVDEGAGSAAIDLTLDRAVAWPVTVSIAVVAGGSAGIPADAGAPPATVTIPAGASTASISLPIVADAIDEDDETLVLAMASPIDALLGAATTHTLTIRDDDAPPVVAWSAPAATVEEGAGTATATLVLSAASGRTIRVPIAVAGTASVADHGFTATTIVMPAGATTAAVVVPIVDDQRPEPDETVILAIGAPEGAVGGEPATHTITIHDNDVPPTVAFAVAASQAAEGAGTVAIELRLDRAVPWPVQVSLSSAGTAVVGVDVAALPASVTIPASSTAISIPVGLIDDALDGPDLTLVLTLADPVDAVLGAIASHTLTITDDDAPPSVAWVAAAVAAGEADATVTVGLRLSAVSGNAVSVPYAVGGTAGAGDHRLQAGTVVIPAGTRDAVVAIPLIDDDVPEAPETILLTLGQPVAATLGTPAVCTVTISDDDPLPVVACQVAASTVPEAATQAIVSLTLDRAVSYPVAVDVAYAGTATAGADLDAGPAAVVIPAGSRQVDLVLALRPDDLVEGPETIVVRLTGAALAAVGAPAEHVITIADDDVWPAVSFRLAASTAAESAGTVPVVIELSAVPTAPAAVSWLVGGDAALDADHRCAPGRVVIPVGSTSATIDVPLIDDTQHEATERIVLTLTGPSGATLGAITSHTLSITDDDVLPTVAFAQAASRTTEGAGATTVAVRLDRASGAPVVVALTATGATGTIATLPATLTIPAGASSALVVIGLRDNAISDGDKVVDLAMTVVAGAAAGVPAVHALTVGDDDLLPVLAWASGTAVVAESAGTAALTARLDRECSVPVTATLAVGGTAVSGQDIGVITTTISIPAGATEATVTVPILDDAIPEATETVELTLTGVEGALPGATTVAVLTIGDDDTVGVTPLVEHVQDNGDGTWTAWFGYRNTIAAGIGEPIGPRNRMDPVPENQGQAVIFRLGRTELWPGCAFSSVFTAESLTWHLGGASVRADAAVPAPPAFPGRPQADLPPVVRITAPAAGAVIPAGRALAVQLDAYDPDGSLARVDLLVDGVVAASTVPVRGQAVGFTLAALAVGSHQLSAVAVDDRGLSAVAVPVGIRAGAIPTIALARVGSGAIIAGSDVAVAATPADADGNLDRVEFRLDGVLVATATAAPWQTTLAGLAVGGHQVTAIAIDADGFRAQAELELVATSAPVVQVTSPSADQIVQPPAGGFPLQAAASDADGHVVAVRFLVDGVAIGTATTSPYRVLWSPAAAGAATIVAEATDDAGVTVASAPVACVVNTPPSVAVTAPADGAVLAVGASVTASATATDPNGPVAVVVLLHNGERIQESATGTVTATVAGLTAGDHVFTAEAIDAQGAYTRSAPVRVRVDAPPVVAITAPASGAVVAIGEAVTLTATATDADGTVARVQFWIDGQFLAEDTTAPWTTTWAAAGIGFHLIEVRATDNAGGTASVTTGITVNRPPTARWYLPSAGAVLAVGTRQDLVVEAADADGAVAAVEFRDGDTVIGTDATSPYGIAWTAGPVGQHRLTAVVRDDHGASTAIDLGVLVGQPPVIALDAPIAGAVLTAGTDLAIAATASDPDGTVARVVVAIDGRAIATLTAPPWTTTWPQIPTGSFTVTATATDDLGLSATASAAVIARQMPQVVLIAPVDGQVLPEGQSVRIEAATAGPVATCTFLDGAVVLHTDSDGPDTTDGHYLLQRVLAPGTHRLVARVATADGIAVDSAAVTVRVNAAPTVAITAPLAETVATVGSSITLGIAAADREGVARVDILLGDRIVAQGTGAVASLDVPVLATGPADYVARVVDSDGASALSVPLRIVGNQAPSCLLALADPVAAYDPATGLVLLATAADADGQIVRVEFRDGDTLLGTVAAAPFRFTWFGAEPRAHVLQAVAIDDRGARTPSNTLTVAVNAAPLVRIASPVDGAVLAAPASPTVVVEATDTDDGVARVELRSGETRIAGRDAPPWEFPLGELASATYTLTAVAIDRGGLQTVSQPVSFTVAGGPTVAITAPAPATVLHTGTPLTIAIDAGGPQAIRRIDVRAGDQVIGSLEAAPWTWAWTPTVAGPVTLTATVTDALGLGATSLPVPVLVNAVPTCDLSLTTTGGVVLAAQAADSDGQVVQVEFHADDVLMATVTTAPYTWAWADPPAGRHVLTATAVDDRGARTTAPARILTVGGGTVGVPPTVRLTAPVAGARLLPGVAAAIAATATDADGTVAQVEFLVGATSLATVAVPPYAASWTPPGPGRFAVTAIATDDAGNTAATAMDVLVEAAPQVALIAPAPQTVVQPGQPLALTAMALGTVAQVEFLLDGAVVATDTAAPWSAQLAAPAVGGHQLAARATDDRGVATTSAAVPIIATTAPTVAMAAPASGSTLIRGEPATLTATATDDGAVVQVVFRAGDEAVAGASQAPWSATWVPRSLGDVLLTAEARDDHQLATTSAPVAVRVVARPTCGLEAALAGDAVTLTATPADADGTIARVEFRVDGTTVATRSAAPWTTTWTPPGAGTYRLQAVAVDDSGLAGASSEQLVSVGGGLAPPTVALTMPAAETRIDSGAGIVLAATATAVDTTITRVEFYDQATLLGTATTAPWTFAWQPAAGLHGVAAVAYAENGAVGVSAQVRLLVDTLPTVAVTAPTAGAVVAADQPLRLTATAADADDGLVQVVFRAGGTVLGTVTRTPLQLDLPAGLPAGSHAITAEAMDTYGQVAVSAPVAIIANRLPTVTAAAPAVVRAGTALPATATASDADGTITAVAFRVDGVERAVDATAPYAASLADLAPGVHSLVAVATDNRGMTATSAAVTFTVDTPPVVAITAPAAGMVLRAGTPTTIVAQAADADGRVVAVAVSVDGTAIGTAAAAPWQVAWMPTPGVHTLTATATDDRGETTVSSAVTVTVQAAPVVTITVPADGADVPVGSPITITATAADADGQVLAVRVYAGSTLLGTATAAPWTVVWEQPAERTHDLTAVAVDDDGLTTTSAVVSIDVVGGNQAPTVALTAPAAGATAWSDAPLPLAATAADADGTVVRVEWLSDGAVIATRTAPPWQAAWSTPVPGAHAILARAIDDRGARTASAPVAITVRAASERPQVALATPAAGARLVAGMPLDLTATAGGPAAITAVTFTVDGVAVGTATAAPWSVAWTPAAPGSVVITATATDATGATGTATPQTFPVVEAGLQIVITDPRSGAVLVADRPTTITAEVYDAVDIDRVEFYAGGVLIGTDTQGPAWTATWTPTAGAHTLTAVLYDRHPTAVAANGGDPLPAGFVLAIAESAPVDVMAVVDSGALPQVAFTLPAADRATIGLEPVRGTVGTTNPAARIVAWELTWWTYQDGTPHQVASGTGAVTDAALGLFDSSLMRNGEYILGLSARDSLGRTAEASRVVQVAGEAKPGQFGFSVQDLVVDVAGIPLTITRSYSTLDRDRVGDFGYGWTASFADLDVVVQEQRQPLPADDFSLIPVRAGNTGRDVTLTLPGGRRTTFTFGYSNSRSSSDAVFAAEPGITATLSVNPRSAGVLVWGIPDYTEKYWYWLGTAGFAQSPYQYYDLPSFALAQEDGTTYYIDREDYGTRYVQNEDGRLMLHHWYGKPYLSRITTPNGQTITLADGGMTSRLADGTVQAQIVIVRDAAGRIWKVYDPTRQAADGTAREPATLVYRYGSAGDLLGVDRLTGCDDPDTAEVEPTTYETTTYAYENAALPHYLTSIQDPAQGNPVRIEYDDAGRMVAMVDAEGHRTELAHDIANRTERTTDRAGNTTITTYDAQGNVLSITNANGETVSFQYDAANRMRFRTDAAGTTEYRYDAAGNMVAVIAPHPAGSDPAAYTTSYAYDSRRNVTSVRGPGGSQQFSDYTKDGMLLRVRDDAGNIIMERVYDGRGFMLSETTPFGTSQYGYDVKGNVTTMTDAVGTVTLFENDAMGRVTAMTTGGVRSTIRYDVQGRETFRDLGNGLTVSYQNGMAGRDWTQISCPTLGTIGRSMDNAGRLTGWTTANGAQPRFQYDAAGRLWRETDSLGRITEYHYDAAGRMDRVTDLSTGAATHREFDGAGRVTAVVDALGNRTETRYAADGGVESVTDARSNRWSFARGTDWSSVTDPLSRTTTVRTNGYGVPTTTEYPDGTTESATYRFSTPDMEATDYPVTQTDAGNRTRSFGYSSLSQLTSATDRGGMATWRYVYNQGFLGRIVDPLGQETVFGYDAQGRLSDVQAPGIGVRHTTWQLNGRPDVITLPSGGSIGFVYDHAQRVTDQVSTDGAWTETAHFTWNANDAPVTMTDRTGQTSYAYNAQGRLARITQPSGASAAYQYDAGGRISVIEVKTGPAAPVHRTEYRYLPTGQVERVIDPLGGITRFTWDTVGRLESRVLPNGIATTWGYDQRDRVTSVEHRNAAGDLLASIAYRRLLGGEPDLITYADGSTVSLGYDAAQRLTSETHAAADGTVMREIGYAYDAAGNRTAVTRQGVQGTSALAVGDRLTGVDFPGTAQDESYGYDLGGRTTTIARGGRSLSLTYNARDQVETVHVGGVLVHDAEYDAAGRRTVLTTAAGAKHYLVAPAFSTSFESPYLVTDDAGDLQALYVYGPTGPLWRSTTETGDGVRYYLEDGLGSVIALADGSGAVTSSARFDAFGNVVSGTAVSAGAAAQAAGDWSWKGMWLDSATGMYHVRARDYDSVTGRFLSRDPDEGQYKLPETFAPYSFAFNNPMSYSDPTGRFTLVEINSSMSIQSTLQQSISNYAKAEVRERVRDQVLDALSGSIISFFDGISGGAISSAMAFKGAAQAGRDFEKDFVEYLSDRFGVGSKNGTSGHQMYFRVPIDQNGVAHGNGLGFAGGYGSGRALPDFILSPVPPVEASKGHGKADVIGDVKLSGNSLYNQYVVNGKTGQVKAIGNFARDSTYSRVGLFVAVWSGNKRELDIVAQNMKKWGFQDGVIFLVFAAIDNYRK